MDNNEKKPKQKSFLDTVREIEEAERREELEEESRKAAERAKREEQRRKAYEEKLRQEKLELIKLKQGIGDETAFEAEKAPEKEYTAAEKLSNFLYHNKGYVIVGAFIAALAIFLVYDLATKERPDIQIFYIAADYDMSHYSSELTPLWSEYGEDCNGNGEKLVRMYYVPSGYADETKASVYYAQSDRTKLMGEFQSGDTVLIIGDKESYQSLGILEDVFYDCRELFPDDPYAEELGYRIAGTDLMETVGCDTVDDTDLYASFRIPVKTMGMSQEKMQENFDHALAFWKNYIAEHRVDGLTLDPVPDPEPLPEFYETEDISQ